MCDESKQWQEFFSIGVGSKQTGGKHVLFMDLDSCSKSEAEKIANNIIDDFACGDCYVAESSPNNHHLVCLDLMSFDDVEKIAKDYSHETWLKHRKRGGDLVIRISPKVEVVDGKIVGSGKKPKLVSIIKSPFSYRQKSNALRMIFQDMWNIAIPKDKQFNNTKKYRIHIYRMRFEKNGGGK